MLKVGRINFTFAAAHHLPNHDGLCKCLHGHNYKLEVEFVGQIESKTGMIADFQNIKKFVTARIVDTLDHTYLNDLINTVINGFKFPHENPTAENMVQWMVKVLQQEENPSIILYKIRLWETDNCYVEYTKD